MIRAALFWFGLALCLGVPAALIVEKETLLSTGRVVLLPLAPVDPRSLMQGDYMDLRYRAANDYADAVSGETDPAERGTLIVRLDEHGVATFSRLDAGGTLDPAEQRLKYRTSHGMARFGAESYFFEEGRAEYYGTAKYGELRVSESGDALLARLRDSDRNPL